MSKQKILVLACLVCVSCLLTGAWDQKDFPSFPGLNSRQVARDTFVPGPIQLPEGWHHPQIAPTVFVEKILESCRPDSLPGLEMNLWQCFQDEDFSFQSEGRLFWAAGNKARLELRIQGVNPSSLLVVCDGQCLQRTLQLDRQSPKVQTLKLPAPASPSSRNDRKPRMDTRDKFLENQGCGGFIPFLAELLAKGSDWQKETGTWQGKPVIRLTAKLDPARDSGNPRFQADHCRVFLNGVTLWPLRLEWLRNQKIFLEMEFRDPRVRSMHKAEELTRLFGINDN